MIKYQWCNVKKGEQNKIPHLFFFVHLSSMDRVYQNNVMPQALGFVQNRIWLVNNIIMENPVICIKVTGRHWKYLLLCCFKNNFIFYFRAPKICKICQLNYFDMTMMIHAFKGEIINNWESCWWAALLMPDPTARWQCRAQWGKGRSSKTLPHRTVGCRRRKGGGDWWPMPVCKQNSCQGQLIQAGVTTTAAGKHV